MKYNSNDKCDSTCYAENLALWEFDGRRYAPPTPDQTADEYETIRIEGVRPAGPAGPAGPNLHDIPCAYDTLQWLRNGGSSFMTLPGPHTGNPRDRSTHGWPPIPEHPLEYMGDHTATDECRANYRKYLLRWERH
jgi:hypothetical protein